MIDPAVRKLPVGAEVVPGAVHFRVWAPARLQKAGIQPRDLAGLPTDEVIVLAWMPAASVYFRDPDNNLLEFISNVAGCAEARSRRTSLE